MSSAANFAFICLFVTICPFAFASHHHPHLAGQVITLTDTTFEHDTQATTGSTTGNWFIKFYAPWCGHCKKLAPIWAELAAELKGVANVAHVDCTKERRLASRFQIKSYPTLVFFHDGMMYSYSGQRTLAALSSFSRGEYLELEGKPVPPPESAVTVAKREIKKTASDMAGIVTRSPLAALMIFFAGGFGGLVFGFIVAYSISSAPKPPRDIAAAAAKKSE